MEPREIEVHGHSVSYRMAGDGPVVLLIHGIAGSSATWDDVLPWLADHYTVVAPDLLGHGESAKPRYDYSPGTYAAGIRDLLVALGLDGVTVVGHSLGGLVALNLVYEFPERCERLVLVSSGGLGHEVHPVLRLPTLPGTELIMPLFCSPWLRRAGDALASALLRLGLRAVPDLEELWLGYATLGDVEARSAFLHALRSIVDVRGQRVDVTDRLYLAARLPTLIIWGQRDPIIPVHHACDAAEAIPGSRLEIFRQAGHFPHRDQPRRFVEAIVDFIASTEPLQVSDEEWRTALLAGDVARHAGRHGG